MKKEKYMETLEIVELTDYETERGKPMPSKNHGLVQSNIIGLLFAKYRSEYSFPTELTLEMGKNYVPDICIYPKMTFDAQHDTIRMTQPPITAIEIVSPKQNADDIIEKFEVYFNNGVKSCWYIQPPMATVFIFTPDKKIKVFHEEMLTDAATGISIDLNEVFQ
ncbi:MAG: Uma2 family endonuclease [Verrucomicrobia bacterium]|nr:Uma2 family endonuclease [Cytophagales bacterium]